MAEVDTSAPTVKELIMDRPSALPPEEKARIVLAVLAGERIRRGIA